MRLLIEAVRQVRGRMHGAVKLGRDLLARARATSSGEPRRVALPETPSAKPLEYRGAPPEDVADLRTIREIAERQDGGISSAESVKQYERGKNPGGTHRSEHASASPKAAGGPAELRDGRTGADGIEDAEVAPPEEPIETALEGVPKRPDGGLVEIRRGQA